MEWDEPLFHDNSKDAPTVTQSHIFGTFPFGQTEVVYTATDASGNSVSCNITIKLNSKYIFFFTSIHLPLNWKGHPCTTPNDPINGHKNCTEVEDAVHCTLACQDGYAFAFRPTGDLTCQMSGRQEWPAFPDCSVTTLASVIAIPTNLRLDVISSRHHENETSLCDDNFFLKQVYRDLL